MTKEERKEEREFALDLYDVCGVDLTRKKKIWLSHMMYLRTEAKRIRNRRTVERSIDEYLSNRGVITVLPYHGKEPETPEAL